MASSDSRNSDHAEGTTVPSTLSGNIQVSACSSGLRYRLYPVEVIFPSLDSPWVYDGHLPPKMIVVVFSKRSDSGTFEG